MGPFRRFARRPPGETAAARRVRLTWRCLYVDLEEECPPPETDLSTLEHPIVRKVRELAASYPANLVRIQEIRDTMVYRFTHGRMRVATWLDDAGTIWICAADERDEDTYEFIVDLHTAGELLPGDRDALRLEVEAAARFVSEVRERVPKWVDEARGDPGQEHTFVFEGGNAIRLFVREGDLIEIWVALPKLTAGAGGLDPRMRGLVLAAIQERFDDSEAEWSARHDWPTGELLHHEVAHLGIVSTRGG